MSGESCGREGGMPIKRVAIDMCIPSALAQVRGNCYQTPLSLLSLYTSLSQLILLRVEEKTTMQGRTCIGPVVTALRGWCRRISSSCLAK